VESAEIMPECTFVRIVWSPIWLFSRLSLSSDDEGASFAESDGDLGLHV